MKRGTATRKKRGRHPEPQAAFADGVQRAREVASNVAHNVSDAGSYVHRKADDLSTAVGNALEDAGHYLQQDGVDHIANDVTSFVRRNPIPAVLAGGAVGFLIARAIQRHNNGYDDE